MEVVDKKVLYSGKINIEYGQFYIGSSNDDEDEYMLPEDAFEDQINGLCGAAEESGLFFVAGVQNGTIKVDVELLDKAPPLDETFGEVVEVSFKRSGSPLFLLEWGELEGASLDLKEGDFRARYSIDGMDKDYEDDDDWDEPLKEQRHLIQIWNGPKAEDKILKKTTEEAKYWHREWGSSADI